MFNKIFYLIFYILVVIALLYQLKYDVNYVTLLIIYSLFLVSPFLNMKLWPFLIVVFAISSCFMSYGYETYQNAKTVTTGMYSSTDECKNNPEKCENYVIDYQLEPVDSSRIFGDKLSKYTLRYTSDLISRFINYSIEKDETKRMSYINNIKGLTLKNIISLPDGENGVGCIYDSDDIIYIVFRGVHETYEMIQGVTFKGNEVLETTSKPPEYSQISLSLQPRPGYAYATVVRPDDNMQVHHNFHTMYKDIEDSILNTVNNITNGKDKKVILTGFSMGGFFSIMSHISLYKKGYDCYSYIYGTPRLTRNAPYYISDRIHNVINTDDVLCYLPLPLMPDFYNDTYIKYGTIGNAVEFSDNLGSIYSNHHFSLYLYNVINNIDNFKILTKSEIPLSTLQSMHFN